MSAKPTIFGSAGFGFIDPVTGKQVIHTSVSGVPTGTGTQADYAVGSSLYDTATGEVYTKVADAGQSADWDKKATHASVQSAIVAAKPFNELVSFVDASLGTLPIGTAGEPILLSYTGSVSVLGHLIKNYSNLSVLTEPVSITDGNLVLFGTLSTNPGVYTYNQATGTFIVVESSLLPGATACDDKSNVTVVYSELLGGWVTVDPYFGPSDMSFSEVYVDVVSTTLPTGTANTLYSFDKNNMFNVVEGIIPPYSGPSQYVSIGHGNIVIFTEITQNGAPSAYIYDKTTGTFIGMSDLGPGYGTKYTDTYGNVWENVFQVGWVRHETSELRTVIATEVSYIDSFLGKTSGNSLPTYSSTFTVANNDTLQTAIGKLDLGLSNVASVIATGISWREPVVVNAIDVTTLPTGTAGQPITVDTVSITDMQRVLFSSLSSDSKNVYMYDEVNGVFVEDGNTLTSGDTVFVVDGTTAGRTYIYNGTDWVYANQSALDEDGFQNAFTGKTGIGNFTPSYSSNNVVVDTESLQTSISKLDAETGYVESFIGKSVGSSLPTYSSNNYVATSDALNVAIGKLDTQLSTTNTAANNANTEIGYIDTFIGKTAGNNLPVYSSTNVVATSDTAVAAIGKLDAEAGYLDTYLGKTAGNNTPDFTANTYVTGSSVYAALNSADAVLKKVVFKGTGSQNVNKDPLTVSANAYVQGTDGFEFDLVIIDQTTPANKYYVSISLLHNGTAVADATVVSFDEIGIKTVGSAIAGLTYDFTLTGTGVSQQVVVTVGSTNGVDVKLVKRSIAW